MHSGCYEQPGMEVEMAIARLNDRKKFTYHWLYIPTGETGENKIYMSRGEFLEMMSLWNSIKPHEYKYWEEL